MTFHCSFAEVIFDECQQYGSQANSAFSFRFDGDNFNIFEA
jgi:hypothetical protein